MRSLRSFARANPGLVAVVVALVLGGIAVSLDAFFGGDVNWAGVGFLTVMVAGFAYMGITGNRG